MSAANSGFIVAAYALTGAVIAALILFILRDYRMQLRALSEAGDSGQRAGDDEG